MLDRLSLTVPGWTERHVPDLGITLVELLAYEGDRLSYRQDAVATEAYLDTARLRSVRRHALLVDYPMHDGCAARAWVCLETDEDVTLAGGRLPVRDPGPHCAARPRRGAIAATDLDRRNLPPYQIFEPMHDEDVAIYRNHSMIHLWTWGDAECCLPIGATSATLVDGAPAADPGTVDAANASGTANPSDTAGDRQRLLRLRPGDVLIFEEILGAKTSSAAPDQTHRQAVRLVSVTQDVDALYDQPILRVTWARADALRFPFCVTSRGGPACTALEVGVARGNVVLVEHGASIDFCHRPPETVEVPTETTGEPGCPPPVCFGCPDDAPTTAAAPYPPLPIRFAPVLGRTPVTQSAPFPIDATIAAGQADVLRNLPQRVLRRLSAIWQALTPPHDQLPPADRAYLTTVFGEAVLTRVHLDQQPRHALATLVARFDELLAAKLARLAELARRARAGYVLRFDAEGWEVGQSWGDDERDLLRETDPRFRGPAIDATSTDPRAALPEVSITDQYGQDWSPRRDLLHSEPTDRHFVGEVDDDAVLTARFGDGRYGMAFPLGDEPGRLCTLRYRVGNGTDGNVGAGAISRIVLCSTSQHGIQVVRNLLPAGGGVDPEPVADVRASAPIEMTSRLLRAITAGDYAAIAGGLPGVRAAAADLRWTGSWYEAQVSLQAPGVEVAPDWLLDAVREGLFRYRRIGHDLAEITATLVPLDVAVARLGRAGLRRRAGEGRIAGSVRQPVRPRPAQLRHVRPGEPADRHGGRGARRPHRRGDPALSAVRRSRERPGHGERDAGRRRAADRPARGRPTGQRPGPARERPARR